jgi:hypothetical protein
MLERFSRTHLKTDENGVGVPEVWRSARSCLLFAALAMGLAACATGYQNHRTQPVDGSFRPDVYTFSGTDGDTQVAVYYKAFDTNDRLSLCGLVAADTTSFGEALIKEWFRQADVILADTNIGRGLFFAHTTRVWNVRGTDAGCVDTDIPWSPLFEDAPMGFEGGRVRRNF